MSPGGPRGASNGTRLGKFENRDRKVLPIGSVLLSELWKLLGIRRGAAQNQIRSMVKVYLSEAFIYVYTYGGVSFVS